MTLGVQYTILQALIQTRWLKAVWRTTAIDLLNALMLTLVLWRHNFFRSHESAGLMLLDHYEAAFTFLFFVEFEILGHIFDDFLSFNDLWLCRSLRLRRSRFALLNNHHLLRLNLFFNHIFNRFFFLFLLFILLFFFFNLWSLFGLVPLRDTFRNALTVTRLILNSFFFFNLRDLIFVDFLTFIYFVLLFIWGLLPYTDVLTIVLIWYAIGDSFLVGRHLQSLVIDVVISVIYIRLWRPLIWISRNLFTVTTELLIGTRQ